MNSLAAIIFDMNGTVLHDEGLYTESFTKVLKNLKKYKPFKLEKGISLYKNWQILVQKLNIDDQKVEDLVASTQEEYKKLIKSAYVMPGFLELSQELKKNKIKTALATSNEKEITEFVFRHFKLKKHFEVVVTASDVNEVKPNPEIFLLASKNLNTDPKNAIVIEDAQAGVDAARKGGFKVVGIENDSHLKNVDLKIRDFREVDLAKLQELVKVSYA